jgi:acetolactate synthase-1/2/3 large subunit
MLGADLLVQMLINYGVEVVFGVPGDTSVPYYEALQRRAGDIRHVLARDERSAGSMADAYARLGDKPAVFDCPSGAGALYSLPPLAEANGSSVPVILLTLDLPLASEGRGALTELDTARLFEPVTKMSVQVKAVHKLPETIRRAFRAACTGRPGAVHLQIPKDVLTAEIDPATVSLHAEPECRTFPAYRAGAAPGLIQELYGLLAASRQPLIVAGGGVNRSRAGAVLGELATRLNVPVVCTLTGQGALPGDHPLAMGVIGDNGFHPHANRALEEADLVLFVGSRVGSVVTSDWTFPSRTLHRRAAQIDIDPGHLGNTFENLLAIAGDARMVLGQMLEGVPPGLDPARCRDWVRRLGGYRARFWDHAGRVMGLDDVPLRPERVMGEFNRSLQRHGRAVHLLADPGTSTPYLSRFLRLEGLPAGFVIPRAFGALGVALPAVVGAWQADPARRPVAMFGDGSFNMAVGELETLVRLEVPALLMLFNNACFGWVKGLHRLRGHDACFGVDFLPPRGQAIAEAFGLKAWTVQTPAQLTAALDAAFDHRGPCLLDIHVESMADRLPPVYSWQRKAGEDPLALDPRDAGYPGAGRSGRSKS